MGQRDPRVDACIANAAPFARPLLAHLREAVHEACAECEETLRWGSPSFDYRGRVLCGMSAFKQHAAFWLWHGRSSPPGPELPGAKAGEAMGQFGRLTCREDLPDPEALAAAIREGMRLIEAGAKRPYTRRPVIEGPELPGDFADALQGHAEARAHFDAFPPGARRDYIQWFNEAKRPDTRARRIAQSLEWLAEGKRRHWKYEKR